MNYVLVSLVLIVIIAVALFADRLHAKRQQRALLAGGTVPDQVTGMDGGGLARAASAEAKLAAAGLSGVRSRRI